MTLLRGIGPALRLQSETGGMVMVGAIAIVAIYWGALLAGVYAGRHDAAGTAVLTAVAGMVLGWCAWRYAASAVLAAAIFRQTRLPHGLWRAWLLTAIRRLTYLWIAFGAGGMFVYGLAGDYAHLPAAPALMSICLCAGVLLALSHLGVMPRAWMRLAVAGLSLALFLFGATAVFGMFVFQPWPVEALLALAWPALAVCARRYGIDRLPVLAPPPEKRRRPVWQRLNDYGRRYTSLAPRSATARNGAADNAFAHNPLFQILLQYLMLPLILQPWMPFAPQAGTMTMVHIVLLLLIPILSINMVVIKDLHWRTLLAPGGLRQGRLGWHILKTTLAMQWCVFGGTAIVLWLVATLILQVPQADLLAVAWRYRLAPIELLFGASAAVLITAYVQRAGSVGIVIAAILLTAGCVWLAYWRGAFPVWFSTGPAYAAVLLALSAAMAAWSNRAWTVNKLAAYVRTP